MILFVSIDTIKSCFVKFEQDLTKLKNCSNNENQYILDFDIDKVSNEILIHIKKSKNILLYRMINGILQHRRQIIVEFHLKNYSVSWYERYIDGYYNLLNNLVLTISQSDEIGIVEYNQFQSEITLLRTNLKMSPYADSILFSMLKFIWLLFKRESKTNCINPKI